MDFVRCPKCKAYAPADAAVCSDCGSPLDSTSPSGDGDVDSVTRALARVIRSPNTSPSPSRPPAEPRSNASGEGPGGGSLLSAVIVVAWVLGFMGTAFAWLGSQVYSGGTPPDPPNLTFLLGLVLIAVAGPVLLRSVRGTPVSEPAGRLLVAGLVALLVIGALESSSGGSPDEPPSTTQPTGAGIVLRQGLPYEGEGGGHWYEVDVLWFTPRTWVTVQCHDSDRQEFLSKTFWIDETGSASDARLCRSREGLDHWVTGGGVESNHVSW